MKAPSKANYDLSIRFDGRDRAVAITAHDLDLVLDLCERTIILTDGRIAADGATREIFADEKLLADNRLEKPLRLQGP